MNIIYQDKLPKLFKSSVKPSEYKRPEQPQDEVDKVNKLNSTAREEFDNYTLYLNEPSFTRLPEDIPVIMTIDDAFPMIGSIRPPRGFNRQAHAVTLIASDLTTFIGSRNFTQISFNNGIRHYLNDTNVAVSIESLQDKYHPYRRDSNDSNLCVTQTQSNHPTSSFQCKTIRSVSWQESFDFCSKLGGKLPNRITYAHPVWLTYKLFNMTDVNQFHFDLTVKKSQGFMLSMKSNDDFIRIRTVYEKENQFEEGHYLTVNKSSSGNSQELARLYLTNDLTVRTECRYNSVYIRDISQNGHGFNPSSSPILFEYQPFEVDLILAAQDINFFTDKQAANSLFEVPVLDTTLDNRFISLIMEESWSKKEFGYFGEPSRYSFQKLNTIEELDLFYKENLTDTNYKTDIIGTELTKCFDKFYEHFPMIMTWVYSSSQVSHGVCLLTQCFESVDNNYTLKHVVETVASNFNRNSDDETHFAVLLKDGDFSGLNIPKHKLPLNEPNEHWPNLKTKLVKQDEATDFTYELKSEYPIPIDRVHIKREDVERITIEYLEFDMLTSKYYELEESTIVKKGSDPKSNMDRWIVNIRNSAYTSGLRVQLNGGPNSSAKKTPQNGIAIFLLEKWTPGSYEPVNGNPVMYNEIRCLFQRHLSMTPPASKALFFTDNIPLAEPHQPAYYKRMAFYTLKNETNSQTLEFINGTEGLISFKFKLNQTSISSLLRITYDGGKIEVMIDKNHLILDNWNTAEIILLNGVIYSYINEQTSDEVSFKLESKFIVSFNVFQKAELDIFNIKPVQPDRFELRSDMSLFDNSTTNSLLAINSTRLATAIISKNINLKSWVLSFKVLLRRSRPLQKITFLSIELDTEAVPNKLFTISILGSSLKLEPLEIFGRAMSCELNDNEEVYTVKIQNDEKLTLLLNETECESSASDNRGFIFIESASMTIEPHSTFEVWDFALLDNHLSETPHWLLATRSNSLVNNGFNSENENVCSFVHHQSCSALDKSNHKMFRIGENDNCYYMPSRCQVTKPYLLCPETSLSPEPKIPFLIDAEKYNCGEDYFIDMCKDNLPETVKITIEDNHCKQQIDQATCSYKQPDETDTLKDFVCNSCHANANCQNSDGSFSCKCNSGYYGNGFNCEASVCEEKDDNTICKEVYAARRTTSENSGDVDGSSTFQDASQYKQFNFNAMFIQKKLYI